MLGSSDQLRAKKKSCDLELTFSLTNKLSIYQSGIQRKSSSKGLAAARTPKIFVIARNVLFYNEKWPRWAIHPLARTKAKPFVVLIAS